MKFSSYGTAGEFNKTDEVNVNVNVLLKPAQSNQIT